MPTEITFWIGAPGFPGRPTLSTCCRSASACSCFVSRRAVVPVFRLGRVREACRLLALLRLLEDLRVDVQQPLGVAELLDQDALALEGMVDPRRRLRAVADGDHHRGRRGPRLLPLLAVLEPVAAEKVVGIGHELRQRLVRLGLPVQVVRDVRVDVEELRAVGLRVGHAVVADHHARRLHEAGFDCVREAEVRGDPAEERLLLALLARGDEGRGREVVGGEDPARAVDAVEAADPLGRLLHLCLRDARYVFARRDAPGVMRLVVHHQEVSGAGELSQHLAHVGLVALRAPLVDRAPLRDPLLRLPAEHVPVAHEHLPLPQPLAQRRGHDVEGVVVVLGVRGQEHLEAAAHGEPRGHHEDVLREAAVLRVGHLVEHVPGNRHRHHDGLAGSRRELHAPAREGPAVARDLNSLRLRGRRLGEPDERLDRLELAEEEALVLAAIRRAPVVE
jgi:hypothetical protein